MSVSAPQLIDYLYVEDTRSSNKADEAEERGAGNTTYFLYRVDTGQTDRSTVVWVKSFR